MTERWRRTYEEAFTLFADAHGARAFEFGRHALFILLKALDVQPGDKVGVSGFTCLAVVEAIKVCGAIPVYLDIDEHLCIDPQEILIHDKGSLKVVILQHTLGNPGRFEQLLAACDKIGTKIIEDCAHSPSCFWNNQKLGKWGEGTVGQGGMLTVNSSELLDKVDYQIKQFAAPASQKSELVSACLRLTHHLFGQSQLDYYLGYQYSRLRSTLNAKKNSLLKDEFPSPQGYARLMGEMTAKAKMKQFENWCKLQEIRRQNTLLIDKFFVNAQTPIWPRQPQANIAMLRYPLRVYKKWDVIHQAGIRGLDIEGWYYSPVHPLGDSDLARVNYQRGYCVRAEGTIERLVHLPTGQSLDKHKLEAMIKIIEEN
jgi:dTDP-4-amino-4,6-dideoxygalactose transaminase